MMASPSTSNYKVETCLQIREDENDGSVCVRRPVIRDSFAHDRQRSQNLQIFRQILERSVAKTNDSFTIEIFQKLFNAEEFLCILFKLFDYINIGELDRSEWINFLYSHFTHSEKEKEFVEIVEVAAYGSFEDESINLVRFQKLFNTSGILTKKLFALIHLECQRTSVTVSDMVDFFSRITSPRLRSHLSEPHIEYLKRLFRTFKSEAGVPELGKKDLAKILPSKESFFTDRVFDIFDHDNSGTISEQEFLDTLITFASMSDDDKLSKFLFVIYDINNDGLIQVNELEKVLMACIRESKLTFSDDEISKMTVALFEDADRDKEGSIDFESLKRQLEQHPGLLKNMSISIGNWLIPPEPGSTSTRKTSTFSVTFLLAKIRNYIIYFGWIFIIFGVNIGLFTQRFISFREDNPDKTIYLAIARSAGQCLNFNGAITLFWMLRHSLTILRAYGIGRLFPLDHHVYFHQLCGCLLFLFTCVHVTAHLLNIQFGIRENESYKNLKHLGYFDIMFDPSATDGYVEPTLKLGLIPGYAFNSGVWLTLILLVMFTCSMPFIRRTKVCFEVFYVTHLMYWIFWPLLIIHAPNFWKWFIGPGVIFLCEQIHRLHRIHMGGGKTYIQEAVLLPSQVTKLVIPRPLFFRAKPGDYIFLRIPKISNFEWHPFTISSAPEDDVITVHIRGVGSWTNAVYKLFTKQQEKIMMTKLPWVLVQKEDLTNNVETTEFNERQIKTQSLPAGSKSLTLAHCKPKCNTISVADGGGAYRCDSHPNVYLRSDSYKYMRTRPTVIELRQSVNIEDRKVKSRSLDSINECGGESRNIGLKAIPETSDKLTVERVVGDSIEVYIDGPFGAPSSNIFDTEHAVLIATGIGVTPFASILLSIMHRYVSSKISCPECQHSFCNGRPLSLKALKKVDFFWINRDQTSFEWFVQILSRLEIEQAELGNNMERFLDLHMYITSALERNDMKASLLQLALDLVYEKEKRDLISGLKSRTNSGRPNWEKIFNQLREQRKGRVTVFFCGQPAVAKVLEKKCDKFQFEFRQEVF